MEEAVRSVLLGAPSVSALAGNRVAFVLAKQGTALPFIVLATISDAAEHDQDGPVDVSSARIQVDAYGLTYGDAKRLGRAVRAVLDGYSGGILLGVFLAGTRDGSDTLQDGTTVYRVSADYLVQWQT